MHEVRNQDASWRYLLRAVDAVFGNHILYPKPLMGEQITDPDATGMNTCELPIHFSLDSCRPLWASLYFHTLDTD